MVGISSSPPATPRKAATAPINTPASMPAPTRVAPSRIVVLDAFGSCATNRTPAMSTSRTAMIRRSRTGSTIVAELAPIQAPSRLPVKRFATTHQSARTAFQGTDTARNGSADATTTRLMALFMITASRGGNAKNPRSSGSRNSAPPRPISPPRAPIRSPPRNAVMPARFFTLTSRATVDQLKETGYPGDRLD